MFPTLTITAAGRHVWQSHGPEVNTDSSINHRNSCYGPKTNHNRGFDKQCCTCQATSKQPLKWMALKVIS